MLLLLQPVSNCLNPDSGREPFYSWRLLSSLWNASFSNICNKLFSASSLKTRKKKSGKSITRRRTVDGKDFEGHSISRCSVNPSVSPPDWVAPWQAIRGCLLHLKFWKRVEKEGFERVLNEGRVRLFRRLVEAWQIGADGAVFLERARNLINRSKQQGEPPAGVVENKGPIKVNSLTGREGGLGGL